MPRRLIIAAELVRDVCGAMPASERAPLETLAEALEQKASEIAERRRIDLGDVTQLDSLVTSIRYIAAAVDPESPTHLEERPSLS